MRKRVTKIVKHPLFSGSAIMVVGSNLNNVFTYAYHIIFGRFLLTTSQYGDLVSVLSLLGLLGTTFGFFGLVIVKFAATTEESELGNLFAWFDDKTTKIGLLIGGVIFIFSPQISNFLQLDQKLIILTSILLIANVKVFTARSFLNGLLKFKQVVIGTNIDILSRIIFGSVFVYLGFSVFGAVMGLLIASLIAFSFYYKFLKINKPTKKVDKKIVFKNQAAIIKYALQVFILSIATMSFFSSDVILVKHFLNAHEAGIYGGLANMGKIIFYALAPVATVMFPMVSKKHANGEQSSKVFYFAAILVLTGVTGVLFVYKFFPDLAIKLLFGSKFLEASGLLFYYGVVMAMFSFSSLLINYFLSIEKYFPIFLMGTASIFQIVGIVYAHLSLLQVVNASFVAVLYLFTGLLIYSLHEAKKT